MITPPFHRVLPVVLPLVGLCVLVGAAADQASAQVAQFKVVSPDIDDDYVGADVEVQGTRLLYSGRDSAFLLDVATGEQREFAGPPVSPAFGVRVAMDGDLIAVGAWGFDGQGGALQDSGAVDLYDRTTGQLLHRLEADDAEAGDQLGVAVAVSGDRVLVGAWGDDDAGNFAGAAYVFDAVTGQQLHKLTPSNGDVGYSFGLDVALDGDYAVVGAQGADFMGPPEGAVYAYDIVTGAEIMIFSNPEPTFANDVGRSVDIDGTVAIIGNRGGDVDGFGSAGKAWLVDVTTGAVLHTLEADPIIPIEGLGEYVALDGGVAVCAAPSAKLDGQTSAGRVVLFDTATGAQLSVLTAEDLTAFADFGQGVAIDGDLILCAADRNGPSFDGMVYVNDLSPDTWYDTGAGRAGSGDVPRLTATGTLQPDSALSVDMTGGLPGATATLVAGFDAFSLPAKQTVLVPTPDVILYGLSLDADGELSLPTHWPTGIPSGFRFFLQVFSDDPAAMQGLAASNGVAGFTP